MLYICTVRITTKSSLSRRLHRRHQNTWRKSTIVPCVLHRRRRRRALFWYILHRETQQRFLFNHVVTQTRMYHVFSVQRLINAHTVALRSRATITHWPTTLCHYDCATHSCGQMADAYLNLCRFFSSPWPMPNSGSRILVQVDGGCDAISGNMLRRSIQMLKFSPK